jgi:polysaccharide export outer membrane protein
MILLTQAAPEVCVGVGDVVQVSVFESPHSDKFVTLPSQVIDAKGMLAVPFAGVIKAAGRPLSEIRREIETNLAKRAVETSVEVTVIKQSSTGQCLR